MGVDRKENVKQTIKRLILIYPSKVVAKKGKISRKWAMMIEAFFLDNAEGNNSRDGWGYTAGLDFKEVRRLMSTNSGEAIEKKEKINRKWSKMTEVLFF